MVHYLRFFNGDSAPFFALVGVSLATGTGILTRDDELEGVCYEIREAVSKFQHNWAEKELNENFVDQDFNLKDLEVGPPIAKGCSAVVYAAKFKDNDGIPASVEEPVDVPVVPQVDHSIAMSPVQNISRFIHNFGSSVDNLFGFGAALQTELSSQIPAALPPVATGERERNVHFNSRVSRHSFSSSYSNLSILSDEEDDNSTTENLMNFPLALKIMFNYDIESNAMSILRAMHKETVPARRRTVDVTEWERSLIQETMHLPAHPNVVAIYGVFCDRIPKLKHASRIFPMALPPRLNPKGYGRNMSLFLLMKRYEMSLKEYLLDDVDIRDRVLLFAQLLEAVTHLNRHGVAHRDIKTDNVLIELNEEAAPVLVLSDFGCCIADRQHGLQIPFTSGEIDKGGNTALMAPEIILKQPGVLAKLDYSKADLWACGAIAYEIFGQENPFYVSETGEVLRSQSYEQEELPQINEKVPVLIRKLVENILEKSPRKV